MAKEKLKIDGVVITVESDTEHVETHDSTYKHVACLTLEDKSSYIDDEERYESIEVTFGAPGELDTFINELLQIRHQVWPWPPFLGVTQ